MKKIVMIPETIVDKLVKKTSRWQEGEMFGLRIHHPYDDSRDDYPLCNVGDVLPPSRLWERDEILEEELNGTSVVGIYLRNGMYYEEARCKIREAVEEVLNYVWVIEDDVLLLVKGKYIEDGPDTGEVLLEDPIVVERIELRKIRERSVIMARDAKQYRVNVYEDGDVIARVRYNQDLDYWDGRNWQNGGMGRHKGITKLKDGRYVIIVGTDWQGERDYAYVVNAHEALQEILKAQRIELLDTKKFAELKKLYEEKYLLEDDDDLEEESLD